MNKIEMKDLLSYRFLSQLEGSPKGGRLALVVSTQHEVKNNYKKELHLMELPLGKAEKVKSKAIKDFCGWQDEDTLLITTPSKKDTTIALFSLNNEKVTPLLTTPHQLNWIKPWSGGHILSLNVDINRPDQGYSTDDGDYIVIEELPFWDNGVGYVSRKRDQLFFLKDNHLQLITNPLCQVDAVALAGDNLFYVGEDFDEKKLGYGGLYRYTLPTGRTTEVIAQGSQRIGKLIYTEGMIVYTATEGKTYGGGEKQDFYCLDPHNLNRKLLFENDYTIGCNVATDCRYGSGASIAAVKGGLVYLATVGFRCDVFYLGVDGEHRPWSNCEGSVDMLTVTGERIYTVSMVKQRLQEVYELLPGGEMLRKTTFNLSATKGRYLAKPRYCGFKNRDGIKIDGWVLLPENFNPNEEYPGILSMHGGPCVAFGTLFHHEMQMFASAGYLVFYTNPRGSDGKGAGFADLRGQYGEIDYHDFMDFTHHILKKYPSLNRKRLAVMGGSYGGYMTNWIIGHTDLFSVAVSQRSFCNPISDFGVSCIGYTFDREQFGGTPWDDLQKLWDHAPLKYAPNAKTPTLFIHALEDYNCPLTEGFQMFSALKYHGIPSKMFLFKEENHELSRSGKPAHRQRRLLEMKNWIHQHIG